MHYRVKHVMRQGIFCGRGAASSRPTCSPSKYYVAAYIGGQQGRCKLASRGQFSLPGNQQHFDLNCCLLLLSVGRWRLSHARDKRIGKDGVQVKKALPGWKADPDPSVAIANWHRLHPSRPAHHPRED